MKLTSATLWTATGLFGAAVVAFAVSSTPTQAWSSGEWNTVERDLDAFSSIRFIGVFEGEISVDGEETIEITGHGDLEGRILTRVEDGELEIKHASNSWRNSAVEVVISASTLERVVIDGAGEFDIDGIDSESFELKLPGAAEIELSGECGELSIIVAGAASVDAEDLECDKAVVRISGTGHIALHANSEVEARISGLGNIEIYGEPEIVEKKIAGLGHIEVY